MITRLKRDLFDNTFINQQVKGSVLMKKKHKVIVPVITLLVLYISTFAALTFVAQQYCDAKLRRSVPTAIDYHYADTTSTSTKIRLDTSKSGFVNDNKYFRYKDLDNKNIPQFAPCEQIRIEKDSDEPYVEIFHNYMHGAIDDTISCLWITKSGERDVKSVRVQDTTYVIHWKEPIPTININY